MEYPEITNKIITIDDAINSILSKNQIITEDRLFLINYSGDGPYLLEKKFEAIVELFIQALNEGWVPDWSNSQEYKYSPGFYMSSNPDLSSSGLSSSGYVTQYSGSGVGSRLCLKNEKLAIYVAKKYSNWYAMFMLPTI
jgi:hypothetical protein